jgi:hypothetical protein
MADANDPTSAAPAAPAQPAAPEAPAFWAPRNVRAERMSRFGFVFALIGLIASLLGPVFDAIGGSLGSAVALIGIGIFLQVCGVFLLAGLVCGILALAWRARPVTLPVLSIIALPLAGVLLAIELFVIFLVTT